MLGLTPQRQQTLTSQKVSQCHVHAATLIANTAIYMRLKHPYTCQTNDVTTFDLTDEQHR